MPSRRSRLKQLSPMARQRLAHSLACSDSNAAYDEAAMNRRRSALWCYLFPEVEPAETRLMRRYIGWPVELGSARRIWALRRQRRTFQALRQSPAPRLP